MSGDGFNLFIDLELDVDTAPSVIDSRLEELRYVWSARATRGDRDAKLRLSRMAKYREVLAAPNRLAEHAGQAADQRKAATRQAVEELNALIAAIAGPADEAKIAEFAKRFKKHLTEAQVRATFAAAKTPAAAARPRLQRPLLEASLADRIRNDLKAIGKSDLYAFLDEPGGHRVTPRSSEAVIRTAADALAARLKNKTDTVSTVRQGLVGHCLAVLCKAERRAEYDNSLALEAVRPLVNDLHLLADHGVLQRMTVDTLAARAVARGVAREAALDYLESEIEKRGLRVAGDRTAVPATRVCGHDGTLIHDPAVKHCPGCGRPLEVECPRCRKQVPTEHAVCACGFRTGDFPFVTALDDEGRQHLRGGRDVEAMACYERALAVWPDWPPAVEARARIAHRLEERQRAADERLAKDRAQAEAEAKRAQAIRERIAAEEEERAARSAAERRARFQQLEDALAELQTLVEERRLLAAQPRLEFVTREAARGEAQHRARLATLHERVTAGLDAANAAMARARRAHSRAEAQAGAAAERAEQRGIAIAAYEAVLAACSDHDVARTQLRGMPPPAPSRVSVTLTDARLRISWSEVPEATGYRVVHGLDHPPSAVGDGRAATVARPPFEVASLEPGRLHYCAVYAERRGVLSASAAVSGPHLWAAEVEALRLARNRAGVSLHFRVPPRGCRVEVTRRAVGSDNAPLVVAATLEGAHDPAADRALAYDYTVRAVYRDAAGNEHRSSGVTRRIDAAPRGAALTGATAAAPNTGSRSSRRGVRTGRRRIWSPLSVLAAAVIAALLAWLALAYACSPTVAVRRTGLEPSPGPGPAARGPACEDQDTERRASADGVTR